MANAEPNTSTTSISPADVKRMRREILRYLWLRGRPPTEGSTSVEELSYLANLVPRTGARLIGEIGFNAGFSSFAFLSASPDTQVVSFDLGEHGYSKLAKQLIDKKFPNRHTLVVGDSTKIVPDYKSTHPDLRFDLVFIDGGHQYEVAKADIENMRAFCTEKTAVVMDDLTPWLSWGEGPMRAWTEAIESGMVRQEEMFKDGQPVAVMEPPGKRSWALGRYIPKPDRIGGAAGSCPYRNQGHRASFLTNCRKSRRLIPVPRGSVSGPASGRAERGGELRENGYSGFRAPR
ncbi:hypothetical protein B1R94_08590 [Mycolicibacterium litorale]|nr:hypothetical protein B1R94_08590 [Mycolicibacterium litorale]